VSYLLPALLAWTIAQVTKVILTSLRQRRLNLRVLAEMGGMPSSHAAIVMGLTAAVGRLNGVTSATFAIALIFAIVVMYDAQGVRRAAGRVDSDQPDNVRGRVGERMETVGQNTDRPGAVAERDFRERHREIEYEHTAEDPRHGRIPIGRDSRLSRAMRLCRRLVHEFPLSSAVTRAGAGLEETNSALLLA